MLLSAEQQGSMVFHILENNYHKPFVGGKANRENIEEEITIGLYKQEIPPCNQEDVDWICDLVDAMIIEYGGKKQ
jgi:hypothetical protein